MQRRIIISVVLSVVLIMTSLGVISSLTVNDSINRSLQNRLALANIVSKYVEDILESNLKRLYDISISGRVDFDDEDWLPEKKALKTAYEYSIFTDRIFLLDMHGNVVLTYPHREKGNINLLSIPYISNALSENRQIVSDIYTFKDTGRKVIFTVVPLRDKHGEIIGAAGGEIDPSNYIFAQVIQSISTGENTTVDLVDSFGTIIASDDPSRILTSSDHDRFLSNLIVNKKKSVGTCHRCHIKADNKKDKTKDMLAFSPLSIAPWGVSIREPQSTVFEPATNIKRTFLIIGIIFLGTSLLLALGVSRSVVRPVQSLIKAATRIAKGELEEPIQITSGDEIGTLARSFEDMRVKLLKSLKSIKDHNIELEQRVRERTSEVQINRKRLQVLFNEVIKAQEDERRRIARELHDETSQSLAALGMSIDIAEMALQENALTSNGIQELKFKLNDVLDGINHLIRDLRPPVLDDLGFESGVRWLLERHLGEKGIAYNLYISESYKAMMSRYKEQVRNKTELMLFRVVQEAIVNIAKHTHARNVSVFLCTHGKGIHVGIEDDGVGFDVDKILHYSDKDGNGGYGIIGMKERVALLDGSLAICSEPNDGTFIDIEIPCFAAVGAEDV